MGRNDGEDAKSEREKRLEVALRANLKRRKEQQRGRDDRAPEENAHDDT